MIPCLFRRMAPPSPHPRIKIYLKISPRQPRIKIYLKPKELKKTIENIIWNIKKNTTHTENSIAKTIKKKLKNGRKHIIKRINKKF